MGRKLVCFKLSRQHPIAKYIGDFYCHDSGLALEVDGKAQEQKSISEICGSQAAIAGSHKPCTSYPVCLSHL